MSQDQPKPEKPTPPTPVAKPKTVRSGTGFQKVIQTLQQTWNRVQPVLKVQSAKVLRGTSGMLQGTAKKLESEPTPAPTPLVDTLPSAATLTPAPALEPLGDTLIPAPALEPLGDTLTPALALEPLGDTIPSAATLTPETPVAAASDVITAVPTTPNSPRVNEPTPRVQVKAVKEKPSFWTRSRVFIVNFVVWWKAALAKIRTRLPESFQQKLSGDTALTGAIAGVFILLFWTISILLPGKSPEVAVVTPTPTATPEVAIVTPEIKTPPELEAPKPPQPVETSPPALAILSPEQNLIATIQKQVGEIIGQYADGFIKSIRANLQGNLLTVKVSDDWYSFDLSKQDNLADDMWRHAREFNFSNLEVIDDRGTLLARNPVVGSNMVILKRL